MDSGRLALLEKAREFGSLAQGWSINELLDRTITYRTLALYLGIQTEWWDEFWRSFSFPAVASSDSNRKLKAIRFSGVANEIPFLMRFMSCWVGKDVCVADINEEDLAHALMLVMSEKYTARHDTRNAT